MDLRLKYFINKNNSFKLSLGFTLIELLVVVSIIGLLASVVLVSLNSARAKSRDARRMGDIKQIQTAFELYFNSNNNYPASGLIGSSSNPTEWNSFFTTYFTGIMGTPKDPRNVWPYEYFYMAPGTYSYCDGGTQHPYEIIFTTENVTYPNLSQYTLQGESGSRARYCVYP